MVATCKGEAMNEDSKILKILGTLGFVALLATSRFKKKSTDGTPVARTPDYEIDSNLDKPPFGPWMPVIILSFVAGALIGQDVGDLIRQLVDDEERSETLITWIVALLGAVGIGFAGASNLFYTEARRWRDWEQRILLMCVAPLLFAFGVQV